MNIVMSVHVILRKLWECHHRCFQETLLRNLLIYDNRKSKKREIILSILYERFKLKICHHGKIMLTMFGVDLASHGSGFWLEGGGYGNITPPPTPHPIPAPTIHLSKSSKWILFIRRHVYGHSSNPLLSQSSCPVLPSTCSWSATPRLQLEGR